MYVFGTQKLKEYFSSRTIFLNKVERNHSYLDVMFKALLNIIIMMKVSKCLPAFQMASTQSWCHIFPPHYMPYQWGR